MKIRQGLKIMANLQMMIPVEYKWGTISKAYKVWNLHEHRDLRQLREFHLLKLKE